MQGQPCNHAYVADSFEKRDDLRSARKFFEFSISPGMTGVGSSPTSFNILNSRFLHSLFPTIRTVSSVPHRCHRSTCDEAHNSSSTDKNWALLTAARSTFRRLPICRQAIVVTTRYETKLQHLRLFDRCIVRPYAHCLLWHMRCSSYLARYEPYAGSLRRSHRCSN